MPETNTIRVIFTSSNSAYCIPLTNCLLTTLNATAVSQAQMNPTFSEHREHLRNSLSADSTAKDCFDLFCFF